MSEIKQKIPNYSYPYAKSTYDKLVQYEVSMQVPTITDDESLIIRLDGKGLTLRFKTDDALFLSDFHLAMRRILENLPKYSKSIKFAYSFKDEISIVLDKKEIAHSKCFSNRIEKVLPFFSGYVSAMFSQYISKKLKEYPTESFTFDARIIIVPTDMLKDYFHARQAFAMSSFIDRLCSFKNLQPYSHTISNVKTALKEIGDDWNNYPQYVCSGYVGYYKNDKWHVDTASDFAQKWYKYEDLIK